ncbi:hypothetical protein [Oceanivirga salmonicida]|uniref:hypothetical protein n=1 Tax=Oceanivirga salmonicida TaxID=1769291 RepID=UPI0012E2E0EC|nr:hypothetical protein [Oceanivirga salmonicida]
MKEKKEKSELFLLLSALGISLVIFYPLAILTSVYFDDPNLNPNLIGSLIVLLWTYPLILLFNLWIAFKTYDNKKILSYILVCWPVIVLICVICLFVYVHIYA